MATLPASHHSEAVRPAARDERGELVDEASAGRLTLERRDRLRARLMAETPRWYSPWLHLASTTGVGVVALGLAASQLHGVRAVELLVVPATALFTNFFEWAVHKRVLHKRTWPFGPVYDQHTPMHHMLYVEEDMTLRSPVEFRFVLIPAAGVAGIVLSTAPLAFAVARVWSSNAGWLLLLTAALYMVGYELSHLAYHAREDGFVGRLALVRVLRAHHARHHDPRLMQRYNFNVTIPLADWVLRTCAPPGSGRRARNMRAKPQA